MDPRLFGLDRYPIWDGDYRNVLNTKFLMRFWNREIGFETVEMFRHHVIRKMGEIMPYYNQLARTAQLEFDPFETVSIENISSLSGRVHTEGEDTTEGHSTVEEDTTATRQLDRAEDEHTSGTTEGTEASTSEQTTTTEETSSSNNTSGSESQSRVVGADMPQTRLNDYEDYATSANDSASQSTSESGATTEGESTVTQGSESSTDSASTTEGEAARTAQEQADEAQNTVGESTNDVHGEHSTTQETTQDVKDVRRGSEGLKADMLMRYRDTIINIDVQILGELETLFMSVWDTTDSFTSLEYPYSFYGHPYYL